MSFGAIRSSVSLRPRRIKKDKASSTSLVVTYGHDMTQRLKAQTESIQYSMIEPLFLLHMGPVFVLTVCAPLHDTIEWRHQ